MGVGGQHHAPAALPPGKRPGTHCIGGWVGLRTGHKSEGDWKFFWQIYRRPNQPFTDECFAEMKQTKCSNGNGSVGTNSVRK